MCFIFTFIYCTGDGTAISCTKCDQTCDWQVYRIKVYNKVFYQQAITVWVTWELPTRWLPVLVIYWTGNLTMLIQCPLFVICALYVWLPVLRGHPTYGILYHTPWHYVIGCCWVKLNYTVCTSLKHMYVQTGMLATTLLFWLSQSRSTICAPQSTLLPNTNITLTLLPYCLTVST